MIRGMVFDSPGPIFISNAIEPTFSNSFFAATVCPGDDGLLSSAPFAPKVFAKCCRYMKSMVPDQFICQLLAGSGDATNMAFSLSVPACMCITEIPSSRTISFIAPARFCMLIAMAAFTLLLPGLCRVTFKAATGNEESFAFPGMNGLHPSTFAVTGNEGSASST